MYVFTDFSTCVILPQAKNELRPCVILIRPGRYDTEKYTVAYLMCILYYLVQVSTGSFQLLIKFFKVFLLIFFV